MNKSFKLEREYFEREKISDLDKKLLISGLIGISPIPLIGEVGMYIFTDRLLRNYSSFSNWTARIISAPISLLIRLYGIYPLYENLYKSIEKIVT